MPCRPPGLARAVSLAALREAWPEVRAGGRAPGVDRVTLAAFEDDLERRLRLLAAELRDGAYAPRPVRRVWLPKPLGGFRPVGVVAVRDRVVGRALLRALLPAAEATLSDACAAYRPGRSVAGAVARVGRAPTRGLAWTLRADVQDCFPSIDRDLALDALRRLGADAPTRELVRRLLEAGAEEDGSLLSPEPGLPQGGALSPLLCNLVLHGFDRDLAAAGGELTRYADDLVVAVRDRRAAERAHEAAHASLAAHGLRLNADKSGVVSFAQGFRFLGTLFVGSLVLPTLRHVDAKGRATYRSGYDGACAPALHDGPRREPPPSDRAVGRRMARAFRDQREGRRSTALGRALVRAWREDAAEEEDEAPSGSVVWV